MLPQMSASYGPDIYSSITGGTKTRTIELVKPYRIIDINLVNLLGSSSATNSIEVSNDGITWSTPVVLDIADTGQKSGFVKIIDTGNGARKEFVTCLAKNSTSFASGSQGFIASFNTTFTGHVKFIRFTTSATQYTSAIIDVVAWP